jgi:hypothetical protein
MIITAALAGYGQGNPITFWEQAAKNTSKLVAKSGQFVLGNNRFQLRDLNEVMRTSSMITGVPSILPRTFEATMDAFMGGRYTGSSVDYNTEEGAKFWANLFEHSVGLRARK